MKRIFIKIVPFAVSGMILILTCITSCKKESNPIVYPYGTFPDSVYSLDGINSAYDDYNTDCYLLYGEIYILFSSNRGSSGGQFDFEQGMISFIFDQTTGVFDYDSYICNIPFLTSLINTANTDGDDLGPFSCFSTVDGYEYLITASENTGGDLDFFYFKNRPVYGTSIPDIFGPFPANLLNTSANDAYICFDSDQDTAYFSSDVDGNFDIYLKPIPAETKIETWLDGEYSASEKVDSINSTSHDKCPLVFKNLMFFASDRPGGMGGFDLYYSMFRNGKWGSPVNLGPGINSSSDEYRPRIWFHYDFTNYFMIFSSNRPGGEGGYDLYFTGIELPE